MTKPIKNPLISRAWKQTCGAKERAWEPFIDVERACAAYLNRKEAEGTIDHSARSKKILAQISREKRFPQKH